MAERAPVLAYVLGEKLSKINLAVEQLNLLLDLPDDWLARSAWREERHVFLMGNGGSAANAVHLANDFLYGAGISNANRAPLAFAIFDGPGDAMRAGIGMVHQHFMLVDNMTVVENIILGAETGSAANLDLDRANAETRPGGVGEVFASRLAQALPDRADAVMARLRRMRGGAIDGTGFSPNSGQTAIIRN